MKVIDWSIFTVFHFFKKSVFVNRGKKKVLSFVFVLVLVYECYSFCSFCFSCFPFFFRFRFSSFLVARRWRASAARRARFFAQGWLLAILDHFFGQNPLVLYPRHGNR